LPEERFRMVKRDGLRDASSEVLASQLSRFHRVELAVIIPTFNERDNVPVVLEQLDTALEGIIWEAIFVDDDSHDGTAEVLYELAPKHPNVRCLRRIGRRGLASACIEGMLATEAERLAVMDADLQHDPALLPKMLEILNTSEAEIVIGSRFLPDSTRAHFPSARERRSRLGNQLANLVLKVRLSDPLSGFFVLERRFFTEVAHSLSGQGFKILLDILLSAGRPVRFREVPVDFRKRHTGASKLDAMVSLEFLFLLADKLIGRYVPVRFAIFVLVGLSGVAVHLIFLALFFKAIEMPFYWAQTWATVAAMTSNFYLNNLITYRDRRLYGLKLVKGLLSFYVACAIGAFANVQVAEFLHGYRVPWPLAGLLGALIGAVWNYGVTSIFTWRSPRASRP
jgi:dolichol-phosphate mannosyltransferase